MIFTFFIHGLSLRVIGSFYIILKPRQSSKKFFITKDQRLV